MVNGAATEEREDTSMSEQSGSEHEGQQEPLNEEGAGMGMDDEPNTFEPEEDPEATEEPEGE